MRNPEAILADLRSVECQLSPENLACVTGLDKKTGCRTTEATGRLGSGIGSRTYSQGVVPMIPVYGIVELKNGLVIKWLRFAENKDEAVRIVTAQHTPAVANCFSL